MSLVRFRTPIWGPPWAPLWEGIWPPGMLKPVSSAASGRPRAAFQLLFRDPDAKVDAQRARAGALQEAFRRPGTSNMPLGSYLGRTSAPFSPHLDVKTASRKPSDGCRKPCYFDSHLGKEPKVAFWRVSKIVGHARSQLLACCLRGGRFRGR